MENDWRKQERSEAIVALLTRYPQPPLIRGMCSSVTSRDLRLRLLQTLPLAYTNQTQSAGAQSEVLSLKERMTGNTVPFGRRLPVPVYQGN